MASLFASVSQSPVHRDQLTSSPAPGLHSSRLREVKSRVSTRMLIAPVYVLIASWLFVVFYLPQLLRNQGAFSELALAIVINLLLFLYGLLLLVLVIGRFCNLSL